MANTYQLITSVTVGSGGASSIDFTSIPNTYNDLLIKLTGRQNGSSGIMNININNDFGANYIWRSLVGSGTATLSENASGTTNINPGGSSANINWSASTGTTFNNLELYIPTYKSSSNKSINVNSIVENNASLAYLEFEGAIWSASATINRITLIPSGSESFVQYSTAYLYGIKNS